MDLQKLKNCFVECQILNLNNVIQSLQHIWQRHNLTPSVSRQSI